MRLQINWCVKSLLKLSPVLSCGFLEVEQIGYGLMEYRYILPKTPLSNFFPYYDLEHWSIFKIDHPVGLFIERGITLKSNDTLKNVTICFSINETEAIEANSDYTVFDFSDLDKLLGMEVELISSNSTNKRRKKENNNFKTTNELCTTIEIIVNKKKVLIPSIRKSTLWDVEDLSGRTLDLAFMVDFHIAFGIIIPYITFSCLFYKLHLNIESYTQFIPQLLIIFFSESANILRDVQVYMITLYYQEDNVSLQTSLFLCPFILLMLAIFVCVYWWAMIRFYDEKFEGKTLKYFIFPTIFIVLITFIIHMNFLESPNKLQCQPQNQMIYEESNNNGFSEEYKQRINESEDEDEDVDYSVVIGWLIFVFVCSSILWIAFFVLDSYSIDDPNEIQNSNEYKTLRFLIHWLGIPTIALSILVILTMVEDKVTPYVTITVLSQNYLNIFIIPRIYLYFKNLRFRRGLSRTADDQEINL